MRVDVPLTVTTVGRLKQQSQSQSDASSLPPDTVAPSPMPWFGSVRFGGSFASDAPLHRHTPSRNDDTSRRKK
jgi:hypothetical protein